MPRIDFSPPHLGQYLKLVLGLEIPLLDKCLCGQSQDPYAYHRINCNKWASHSWARGHNLVVEAVAFETRRLGLSVVDRDATMRRQFSHLRSQARGDLFVQAADVDITDRVNHCPRKAFVIDVKTVAMVDSSGSWDERWNAQTAAFDNPGLAAAEAQKYRKHEAAYVNIGYSFVAFVCSCFAAFGPSALRYMYVLAALELRQHLQVRELHGLDPLTDAERSQYKAQCLRASTARVAGAMAKASIMRICGAPSIPFPSRVPRSQLACNIPHPADLSSPHSHATSSQAPCAAAPVRRLLSPRAPSQHVPARVDLRRSPSFPLTPSDRLPPSP